MYPADLPFVTSISRVTEGPNEACAMWWVTEDDQNIESSTTIALISSVYSESDGFESYILASLLSHLGLLKAEQIRIKYPDQAIYVPIRHFSGITLLVSADQEHGIRLRFPVTSCSVSQRNGILSEYLEYVQALKATLGDTPKDPRSDPNALEWWRFSLNGIKKLLSEGKSVTQVGYIPHEE